MTDVHFRPRRLGHANLFVADLEKSVRFYSDVAGIELVRREPGISAAFHSNGNTHHDVGLIECSGGLRTGIDGFVQPSSFRGKMPGLNHLGWEVNSEADLMKAVGRAEAAGIEIKNYANHQISHSVYLVDPDGNYHEFYADVLENWRDVFNLQREELVTEHWDWKHAQGRGPVRLPPERRTVDSALFRPRRITHATIVVQQYDASLQFLRDVAGLELLQANRGIASLGGLDGYMDLLVVSAEYGQRPGLHGLSFELDSDANLEESQRRAVEQGIPVVAVHRGPAKHSMLVRDPDGIVIEFYAQAGARMTLPDPAGASSDPLWAFAS